MDRLATSEQIYQEMLRWLKGERSWTNTIRDHAQCAMADAQEVVKLAAALPAVMAYEKENGFITPDRMRELLASIGAEDAQKIGLPAHVLDQVRSNPVAMAFQSYVPWRSLGYEAVIVFRRVNEEA